MAQRIEGSVISILFSVEETVGLACLAALQEAIDGPGVETLKLFPFSRNYEIYEILCILTKFHEIFAKSSKHHLHQHPVLLKRDSRFSNTIFPQSKLKSQSFNSCVRDLCRTDLNQKKS
jgi:hypothetical protein